ncbi:hypothetical protein MTR67_040040 [Solanum verrucosum]|uniref:Uncharacterized protein n=1 Tax=Solanum verrucosum TaxID=315347 RepID=A0AAF0ZRA9_SOLVR|nr:hypothetical protein MTR67_040040 [Solanum verrucosum]
MDGYHSSIQMAPYERRCRFPIGWFEVGEATLNPSKKFNSLEIDLKQLTVVKSPMQM